MNSWYRISVNGAQVEAFMDTNRAEQLGGEPCEPPADLPERFKKAAGSPRRDGLHERGYGPLDELPVGWRHAREARERAAETALRLVKEGAR